MDDWEKFNKTFYNYLKKKTVTVTLPWKILLMEITEKEFVKILK